MTLKIEETNIAKEATAIEATPEPHISKTKVVDFIYFLFLFYFYFSLDLFFIFVFLELRFRVGVIRSCSHIR